MCIFAQNGAALTQKLDNKAPVPDYNMASEKTPNSMVCLQFRPRTTDLRRGGEPLSPRQCINTCMSPNTMSSLLAKILESLKPGMTTPKVVRFSDGHFRKVIYSEQALLSCIV